MDGEGREEGERTILTDANQFFVHWRFLLANDWQLRMEQNPLSDVLIVAINHNMVPMKLYGRGIVPLEAIEDLVEQAENGVTMKMFEKGVNKH